MAQEVRRIMFNQDELIAAFECYRRITPHYLPAGQITACSALDDVIHVTIKPAAKNGSTSTTYTFRGTEAVKPLIRFCIENNIMMPRDGQKSLYVKDGVASLYIVFNLDLNLQGPAAEPPKTDTLGARSFSPADILKGNIVTA